MSEGPLVSFVLFGFNQERFIAEAIEGALAQTYQPLEVVLTDDCSSDATFAIMRAAATVYRGPHRVVLNRNDRNLGIAAHASRAGAVASGSILVCAHGDDVSLPRRTAASVAALRDRPELVAVTAKAALVDATGAPITLFERQSSLLVESPAASREARIARFVRTLRPSLLGGASAWRREVFELLGPLAGTVRPEDLALSFRAILLGEVGVVDEVGFHYRIHGGNISLTDGQDAGSWARGHYTEAARVTWLGVQRSLYPQMARDLARAAQLGLVDFDPTPHLSWIQRQTEILGLLGEQPSRRAAARVAIAARVLARRPSTAVAAAALLRVLPPRTVAAVRRLKGGPASAA